MHAYQPFAMSAVILLEGFLGRWTNDTLTIPLVHYYYPLHRAVRGL